MELVLEKKVNELNYSIFLLQGEKKQLKRKMEVMVKTVKEADRFNSLKSVIMSNMSHEMRTPLNGIMGLATLINESEVVDSETRQFGELIFKSGERMLHTFNRLIELDLNDEKVSNGLSKLISLGEFFESNLKTRAAVGREKGQTLRWHIHNQQESIVSNDLVLSKILMNLVNNALKYSGQKAVVDVHVKILTADGSKNLRISVEDNGPGIDPKEKTKIFEPFFMSSKVTADADKSSGLGLYIVKTYVEYLGGTIDVTSVLGSGSNFTINIPIT
jgi:signal transduction histidine kinase